MKNLILLLLFGSFSLGLSGQNTNAGLVYLVREPAEKSAKTPVVIMMHGYGSNEADLFSLSKALDDKFIVFSLRAPNLLDNGGYAWYKMEFLPEQKFKYNYNDTRESARKVLSFISKACAEYHVDSTQVFLMGFSQGAIMSYEIALSNPKKIKGVVALSGRMLEETRQLKTDWNRASGIKFYIAHGSSDNVIRIADAGSAVEFLKTKKVADLTFRSYNMAHTITPPELNDIKSWLIKATAR